MRSAISAKVRAWFVVVKTCLIVKPKAVDLLVSPHFPTGMAKS